MKKTFVKIPMVMMLALMITGCGATTASNSGLSTSGNSSTTEDGGFSFVHPSAEVSSSDKVSSSSSSVQLNINVLATINANKTIDDPYLVEAEDCDTSGCTLQAGCSSFFEEPPSTIPTSGGECIACISAPSILAFKIDVKGTCDIAFYTVAAKYEDPWNLDGNVSYYLDSNTPFVTGYSAFGHTTENMFYNWKTVELGTTTGVTSGVHQFNIKVLGSFPNTDCFKMVVTNYTAA
ncbi:MAG: hypothetical protein WCR56_05555 [Bacilli bacterium]